MCAHKQIGMLAAGRSDCQAIGKVHTLLKGSSWSAKDGPVPLGERCTAALALPAEQANGGVTAAVEPLENVPVTGASCAVWICMPVAQLCDVVHGDAANENPGTLPIAPELVCMLLADDAEVEWQAENRFCGSGSGRGSSGCDVLDFSQSSNSSACFFKNAASNSLNASCVVGLLIMAAMLLFSMRCRTLLESRAKSSCVTRGR
jgi:hypothetical protein